MLSRKTRKETRFKFYKVLAVPVLLYGSETGFRWTNIWVGRRHWRWESCDILQAARSLDIAICHMIFFIWHRQTHCEICGRSTLLRLLLRERTKFTVSFVIIPFTRQRRRNIGRSQLSVKLWYLTNTSNFIYSTEINLSICRLKDVNTNRDMYCTNDFHTYLVCVCVCAVSYTHLDVYKRQIFYSLTLFNQ